MKSSLFGAHARAARPRIILMAAAMLAACGVILAAPAAWADPAAVAKGKKIELRIATVAPAKTPWSKVLKEFETNVEAASGGRIDVRVFLGGTMGDENTTAVMTARGKLQGVGGSTGSIATLVPELDAIEVPFMFASANEADYVLDKFLLAPMEKAFREHGLILGFWGENGFRHFASTVAPIATPADIRGKKMRSQESFVHLEMYKALSANASAIPTTEVDTSLRTGAIQGYDQSLLYAIAASWHTTTKYLTLSAHIYQPGVIAYNKDWFDALPADLQKIVMDEGRKLTRKGRKGVRDMNPAMVALFTDAKVKVSTLTPAQREAFVTATKGVREVVRKKSAAHRATLELIEKGIAEFRAKGGK